MRYIIIIACIFAGETLFAQHNEFQSLYMYDAISVNPAFSGNKGALVLNANYRDQWGGIEGSPKTFSANTHFLTRSKKVGLGIVILNDRFGLQNTTKFNAVYAYRIRLKKNILSLGVAAGIKDQHTDLDRLTLNERNDAAFTGIPPRVISPDVTLGAMFTNEHFAGGLSIPNLVRINDAAAKQSVNAYASAIFDLNKNLKIKPTMLVKYAQNSPVSYEGNATVFYRNSLSGGAGLRNDQTANIHLRLRLNRQLSIAYLYERNFSPVNRFLRNTHEFMLTYTLDYQTNVQSPRYL